MFVKTDWTRLSDRPRPFPRLKSPSATCGYRGILRDTCAEADIGPRVLVDCDRCECVSSVCSGPLVPLLVVTLGWQVGLQLRSGSYGSSMFCCRGMLIHVPTRCCDSSCSSSVRFFLHAWGNTRLTHLCAPLFFSVGKLAAREFPTAQMQLGPSLSFFVSQ